MCMLLHDLNRCQCRLLSWVFEIPGVFLNVKEGTYA